ncbi:hypothetical protein ACKI1Z_43460, partial [Streptomyces galilaeus]|uniref:hypothetical protein n=1 Tax=Streptomyces galilaeus TaxID=33899 RepID=UPI0038F7FB9F
LKLNDAQKKQVAIAYKDFFIQMDALRKKNGNTQQPPPPPPPPPGKKEEIDKLVTERDAKIAKALSLDEYKKYVEIEKT